MIHHPPGYINPAARTRSEIDIFNDALELAAQLCENSQSGHGNRKGGSDGPDAARRACAILIRNAKLKEGQ